MQRLCDSYTFRPIGLPVITESASGAKIYKRTGVFQNYKKKNCNGRIYPESIWKKTFSEGSKFRNRLGSRSVLGLLEHPKDGQTRLDYGPAIVIADAHIATTEDIRESLKRADTIPLEEGDIVGTFEILNTAAGKELQALDEAGVTYGVSSRGTGTVKESDGASIVQEDFDLETWDAVYNPSVERALPARTESGAPQEYDCMRCEQTFTSKQAEDYCPKCRANMNRTDISTSQEGAESLSANANGSSAGRANRKAPEKPTTMNKMTEMRTLDSQIVSLTATRTTGLKVAAKASLLNAVTEQRVAIDRLVSEDAALKSYAARLHRTLNEFENDLSRDAAPAPAPKGPPALAPKDDAPPAPEAAPEGEEMPEDELLRQAADMLTSKLADDPEAAALADKLTQLADEKAPQDDPDAAPEGGAPAPAPAPSEPPMAGESKNPALEARHKLLLKATGTILERYQALKESSSAEGLGEDGTAPRAVAVQLMAEKKAAEDKATEWEKTSRDIAERYNKDMIAVGLKLWELKRPDLFEKVKDRLSAIDTFEKFTETSAEILKENGIEEPVAPEAKDDDAAAADAAPAEAAPAPAKSEEAPAPAPEKEPAAPTAESTPAPAEAPLEEAAPAKVHPQIEHARRARKNGVQYRR